MKMEPSPQVLKRYENIKAVCRTFRLCWLLYNMPKQKATWSSLKEKVGLKERTLRTHLNLLLGKKLVWKGDGGFYHWIGDVYTDAVMAIIEEG